MNEKPNFFVGLFNFVKAAFIVLALLYIVAFFFYICNSINLISFLIPLLDIFADISSLLFTHSITYNGQEYSCQYIIASVFTIVLAIISGILSSMADSIGEKIAYSQKLARMNSDYRISKKVKKDYAKILSKTGNVLICLKLDLIKKSVDFASETKGLNDILNSSYRQFIDNLKHEELLNLEIKDGKLLLVCDKFKNFDLIFMEYLKILNSVTQINIAEDIATNAYFVLDIIKDIKPNEEEEQLIQKVLSFDYKNLIISTAIFAQRYMGEVDGKFKFSSMGNIRIFENEDISKIYNEFEDDESESNVKYYDVEIFSLSRKKKRR